MQGTTNIKLHIILASAARKLAQRVALMEMRGSNLGGDVYQPNRSSVLRYPEKKPRDAPFKLNHDLSHFTLHYHQIVQCYVAD